MPQKPNNLIGHCRKPHGIRGEIKLESYTDPIEKILDYAPWYLEDGQKIEPKSGRVIPGGLIVTLKDHFKIEDVEHLRNASLYTQTDFVSSDEEGYYWKDLIGMQVYDADDVFLGVVDGLKKAYPIDFVIFIHNERNFYIPCDLEKVIQNIDLTKRSIKLYWHAEDFDD